MKVYIVRYDDCPEAYFNTLRGAYEAIKADDMYESWHRLDVLDINTLRITRLRVYDYAYACRTYTPRLATE